MRRERCIYPYEKDDREELMLTSFETFSPTRVTLFCDELNGGCAQDHLVSRGQCIGFMNSIPVYASIDGRVTRITPKKFKYNHQGFSVNISLEKHRKIQWSELPCYDDIEGSIFLQQLGLSFEKTCYDMDTLWIDGVESEPAKASYYRMYIEESIKIILGASILADYFHVKKVYFCVENEWSEVIYLLQKNLKKYHLLLNQSVDFIVKKYERQYPMPYQRKHLLVFDLHTAIHAYNGHFEHCGVVDARLSVRGKIDRQGNFIVPVGTHVSDLLLYCGYHCTEEVRIVANGLISGHTICDSSGLIGLECTGIYVLDKEIFYEKTCTHCKKCREICPMHLKPDQMDEEMKKECLYCGCCSFVCPSGRHLLEHHRRLGSVQSHGKKIERKQGKYDDKSMYIELAPEFADFLPVISVESDAGPFIRQVKKQKKYFLGMWGIAGIFLIRAFYLYRWNFAMHLVFSSAVGTLAAELLFMLSDNIKRRRVYVQALLWSAVIALIIPVDASLLWLVFANIIACILEFYHL